MVGALSRPPCLVSFSGGRDSSALLGVAVDVARRESLALPIPMTVVFPGSAASEESEWQELVLGHLGVEDRVRLELDDELDAVGPVATAALKRHGLFWPYNAHFHIPIFEQAAGGTVITGFGGDELALSSEGARAARVLSCWRRPGWSDLLSVGLAVAPPPLRGAVYRRRMARDASTLPWLTPEAIRRIGEVAGQMERRAPIGWEAGIRRLLWRDRYFRVCTRTFAVMADFHDVRVVHPFVEASVLDALASAGGFAGLGDRRQLMEALFGDLLPAPIVDRASKASFNDPLWTATAREFVARWSGDGLDRDLVDVPALRQHWASSEWKISATTMLQQAWLHDHHDHP
jgi:hypothetical protein